MLNEVKGIFVPLVTPFDLATQMPDVGGIKDNIESLNQTPIRGYMPLGSNGEFFMLSEEESLSVLAAVREKAGADKLVFAGTGRESVYQTIEFTKKAEDIGVDAAFVLTPHYFPKQMTQECLAEYYEAVADASSIPIFLYHAPDYAAGVTLQAETVLRLAKHPKIAGMKDSSSTNAEVYINLFDKKSDFIILSGTFGTFYDSVRQGALGGVLSCANYIPELSCRLFNLIEEGSEEGKNLYKALSDLMKQTTALYGVGGVKVAMNLLEYRGGYTRSPLSYPDKEQIADMKKIFETELERLKIWEGK